MGLYGFGKEAETQVAELEGSRRGTEGDSAWARVLLARLLKLRGLKKWSEMRRSQQVILS